MHIKGYHLGFGGIDEGNQCKKEAWNMLISRLRRPGFQKYYSAWVTSNTDKGKDWIHGHFFDTEELEKLSPEHRSKRWGAVTTTYENARNLPPEYISNMESTYSKKLQQVLLHGSYESFEGQVFEDWEDAIHVIRMQECFPQGIPSGWNRLLGVDVGGADPWAWEFAAVDSYGNVIVYDEIYQAGARVEPFAKAARPKIDPYRWQAKVIDYENKTAAGELSEHGIQLTNAQKQNKSDSIFRLNGYLHPNPLHAFPDWHPARGKPGSPRIFIASSVKYLRREVPDQRWKRILVNGQFQNELDESVSKHSVDALLYIIRELPRPTEIPRTVISDLSPDLDAMSKIIHFERRNQKDQQKRRAFNGAFGHGRFGGMSSRRA